MSCGAEAHAVVHSWRGLHRSWANAHPHPHPHPHPHLTLAPSPSPSPPRPRPRPLTLTLTPADIGEACDPLGCCSVRTFVSVAELAKARLPPSVDIPIPAESHAVRRSCSDRSHSYHALE